MPPRPPLYLDVFNARARELVAPLEPRPRPISKSVKESVNRRDFGICRFCGFRSAKYQECIGTQPTLWDLESIVTACIFCQQCFHLEQVEARRSGVLVWLPEISQDRLHHLARAVYARRISQGPPAERAREAATRLLKRVDRAEAHLGSREPRDLAERMRNAKPGEAAALRAELEPIRLLPLDRRIIKEADLEFNQFPQILAFWRSKNGPFGSPFKPEDLDVVVEEAMTSFLGADPAD